MVFVVPVDPADLPSGLTDGQPAVERSAAVVSLYPQSCSAQKAGHPRAVLSVENRGNQTVHGFFLLALTGSGANPIAAAAQVTYGIWEATLPPGDAMMELAVSLLPFDEHDRDLAPLGAYSEVECAAVLMGFREGPATTVDDAAPAIIIETRAAGEP